MENKPKEVVLQRQPGEHPVNALFRCRVYAKGFHPTPDRQRELERMQGDENVRRLEAAREKRERKAARRSI